jgi:protein-L-isoaspartate(D-aspartate) O-methyltransferase
MSADFAAARDNMVDSQVRPSDVTDILIQDAMRVVPRETLVPPAKAALAYADAEIEYAPGRWLLNPRDLAKLLQALAPHAGESVLALSAPYAAAVLAAMGLEVTQADAADPIPARAGGWPLIVCEGAVSETPKAWLEALADHGRLGVVERRGPLGRAMIYLKSGATVGGRAMFESTPPILAGFEPKAQFVF